MTPCSASHHKNDVWGFYFKTPFILHMTVIENLVFAMPPDIKGRKRRLEKACIALSDIGLEGLEARDPETLSGGQKARIALAQVLTPCVAFR